jgi:hypothetical protein
MQVEFACTFLLLCYLQWNLINAIAPYLHKGQGTNKSIHKPYILTQLPYNYSQVSRLNRATKQNSFFLSKRTHRDVKQNKLEMEHAS